MVLDWNALPPVQRIELMTTHDLAKREKQKLELLRSLLTYFHYASKETRPDVFRSEIERINRAVARRPRTGGAPASSTSPPTSACAGVTPKTNWANIAASACDRGLTLHELSVSKE